MNIKGTDKIKLRTMITLSSAALVMLVCTLASVAGFDEPDADGHGIHDADDNCLSKFNPSQRDDDEEGYGNLCDWDINNDCVAGTPDIALLSGVARYEFPPRSRCRRDRDPGVYVARPSPGTRQTGRQEFQC